MFCICSLSCRIDHDHFDLKGTENVAWSPNLAPGEKPDLSKIRGEIESLMNAGDYKAALQRQIWYFNHALEFGESNPVRLSFGIMHWGELCRRYPRARQALIGIRDQEVRQFTSGGGYYELFSEIESINRELGDENSTYTLFKSIEQRDSQLAGQCYAYVENLLVEKGEYAVCLKYIGDPEAKFDFIRSTREHMNAILDGMPQFNQSRMRKNANDSFVNDTRRLVEILVGCGRIAGAQKIQDEATAVFNDPRLQSAVNDAEQKVGGKTSAAAPNLSFGPVVERVVPCEMPLRFISGINLESGQVETISFGTNDVPPGGKSGDEYFNEKGVDMIAIGDPKLVPQSSGLNCKLGTFAMPVDESDWDSAPAAAVLSHATNLPSMSEPIKTTPEFSKMTVILTSEDGVFPKTFIFHTRTGSAGILEITGFSDNPRGVKIRYKLVQPSASP